MDLVALSAKEASIETVFRYAHVYTRALALMGSGKIDVKPLISRTFEFQDSVAQPAPLGQLFSSTSGVANGSMGL